MALSDLAVYSEFAHRASTEVLAQQVELFNAATEGAIVLTSANVAGDFNESAYFGAISGLVRRRNAYGSGDVSEKNLAHIKDTEVKVAAGIPPVRIDPSMFAWIRQSPEVAGAALGQQIAKATIADMLSVAIGSGVAALTASDNNLDVTAVAGADKVSFINLNKAKMKLGDRSGDVTAWVMHSVPMHQLYEQNLTNAEKLFTYGSINVVRDPFGKILVMTDADQLIDTGNSVATILGLVQGGLRVSQNPDFFANEETRNGKENIVRTYQAEWSYNVGVKGFSWDKTAGGASPTDAALFTSANWDKVATSNKDLAGVTLQVAV